MKRNTKTPAGSPILSLTIDQFCHRFGMSKAFFFRLRERGDGPAELRVGGLIRITVEAADEWAARHTVQPRAREVA